MEIWKTVEGFDYYEVSNLGRVRSPEATIQGSRGRVYIRKEVILKLDHHKSNCWRVRFCVSQVKTSHNVHRLVAKAFIPNPDNKEQVNHIDGDRLNNNLSNLEWATAKENMQHAYRTGLIANPFGTSARNFKGPVVVISHCGKVLGEYNGNRELEQAGYCSRAVCAVINGRQKTHKGCVFKRTLIKRKDNE